MVNGTNIAPRIPSDITRFACTKWGSSKRARRRSSPTERIGTAAMLRTPALAAEGPPETTSVRLPDAAPGICIAPKYVVADLLRAEGFTKIDRVPLPQDLNVSDVIARGMLDFGLNFASTQVAGIDRSVAM